MALNKKTIDKVEVRGKRVLMRYFMISRLSILLQILVLSLLSFARNCMLCVINWGIESGKTKFRPKLAIYYNENVFDIF